MLKQVQHDKIFYGVFQIIWVEKAKYVDEYKMFIKFNDWKEGIIDLKNVVLKDKRPIFKNLQKVDKFKKFKVDMDTIVWENGLDLAPEFLYSLCEK